MLMELRAASLEAANSFAELFLMQCLFSPRRGDLLREERHPWIRSVCRKQLLVFIHSACINHAFMAGSRGSEDTESCPPSCAVG